MTTDERIESYLHTRSTEIDLPHADLDRITHRARVRRNRRRMARGGLTAALLLGGVAFVAGQPDDSEPVTNVAQAVVVPSELEWSTVPVGTGLGGAETAVADDGTIYALSTAANPDGRTPPPEERVMYRSADGRDWEAVGLPEGLSASSLATDAGALYALGTTAAGGTTGPVDLAVSTDAGDSWSSTELPIDPAAEDPDFPGTVRIGGAELAVDGERTVAAVRIVGTVEIERFLGPDDEPGWWYATTTGLERVPLCPAGADGAALSPPPDTEVVPPRSDDPARDPMASGRGADPAGAACDPAEMVGDHRSWADLGVDPSVGTLVTGYTIVLTGPTGGELTRVEDIPGIFSNATPGTSLVAADDGFWLVGHRATESGSAATLTTWHSADGTSWSASDLPGAAAEEMLGIGAGTVDGRAVLLSWADEDPRLRLLGTGGITVDLVDLLDLPSGSTYASAWDFGPMGLALVLQERDGPTRLVTSTDGLSYAVQEIPLDDMAEPGQAAIVNGVTVTADAIKVRVNVRPAGRPGAEPEAQLLYVGTPS